MKEYIVETRSLKKYYQMGENTVKALVDWMCQQKGKCW